MGGLLSDLTLLVIAVPLLSLGFLVLLGAPPKRKYKRDPVLDDLFDSKYPGISWTFTEPSDSISGANCSESD